MCGVKRANVKETILGLLDNPDRFLEFMDLCPRYKIYTLRLITEPPAVSSFRIKFDFSEEVETKLHEISSPHNGIDYEAQCRMSTDWINRGWLYGKDKDSVTERSD